MGGATTSRKRARSEDDGGGVEPSLHSQGPLDLNSLKTYDIPDILICGNCKDLFSNLTDMIEHKKRYCKLRFTCKCGPPPPPPAPPLAQAHLTPASKVEAPPATATPQGTNCQRDYFQV